MSKKKDSRSNSFDKKKEKKDLKPSPFFSMAGGTLDPLEYVAAFYVHREYFADAVEDAWDNAKDIFNKAWNEGDYLRAGVSSIFMLIYGLATLPYTMIEKADEDYKLQLEHNKKMEKQEEKENTLSDQKLIQGLSDDVTPEVFHKDGNHDKRMTAAKSEIKELLDFKTGDRETQKEKERRLFFNHSSKEDQEVSEPDNEPSIENNGNTESFVDRLEEERAAEEERESGGRY